MIAFLNDLRLKLRNIYKSWVVWFNAAMVALPFALDALSAQLPAMQSVMPPNIYMYVYIVTVVGNVLLRFKTNKSLADK